jgi:WD40 repeat protein
MNRRVIVRIVIGIFVIGFLMWLLKWHPVKAWNLGEDYTDFAININTQLVATGSRSSKEEKAVVKLRNLTDGSIVWTSEIPGHYASCIVLSPDGSLIAICNNLGQVQVWRKNNGQLLYVRELKKKYDTRVVFSPDSSLIGVSNQLQIQVWRADNGELLYTRELPKNFYGNQYQLDFSPDKKSLVFGLGEARTTIKGLNDVPKIEVWNAVDGKHRYTISSNDWQYSISPDGKLIAVGSYWTSISLYRLSDGAFIRQLEVKGYPQFSPDSQLLAISSKRTSKIILYRLEDDQFLDSLSTSNEIRTVVFSPDGKSLAALYDTGGSGASDITVWSSPPTPSWSHLAVWRLVPFAGKYYPLQVAQIKSKKEGYYPLAFTPDSKFLLTRGAEQIRFWRVPPLNYTWLWLLGGVALTALAYSQRAYLRHWLNRL